MPATIPLLQEGRYSIEQEFAHAEGSFLYQAYDTHDETPVTIAEVPFPPSRSATVAERDEAAAALAELASRLSTFRHNGLVAIRTYFVEGGRHYLVTDRVEGVDLAAVLADQNRPFTVPQVVQWTDTLLEALHMMHQARPPIVFGSVRPDNIVMRGDGTVQLIGSGMFASGAATGSAAELSNSSLAFSPLEKIWHGLDAATQRVITSKYDETSERVLKQGLDARSDIFSIGATMYKLVTGHTPADALERSIETIEGNADPLASPHTVDPAIPVEVSDVIMKALEVRREYRFDSAAIMRQVLKTALVRVREREAEEALVNKVEGHDVRPVVQNEPKTDGDARPSAPPAVVRSDLKTEPPVQVDTEQVHRSIAPHAAVKTETFELAELEDDLLGLLSESPHTSGTPDADLNQSSNVGGPAVQSIAAVPEKAGEMGSLEQPATVASAPLVSTVQDLDPPATEDLGLAEVETFEESFVASYEPETTPSPKVEVSQAGAFSPDPDLFSEPRVSGGMGLPAIAAAAVVLIIAGVGGWFYLGSNTAPAAVVEPSAPIQTTQPEEPARSSFQGTEPASVDIVVQPTPGETAEVQTSEPQQPLYESDRPQKAASAAPPKTKRPAAEQTKSPAQKKAVTVDDLINDN